MTAHVSDFTHDDTVAPGAHVIDDHAVLDAPPPTLAEGFRWSNVIGPVVVFIAVIAFWEFMHRWGMQHLLDKKPFLLPSPATVVDQAFFTSLYRSQLATGLWWTCVAAFIGLAVTIVLGVGLAVVMAQRAWVERSIYPYLVALQATPVLAIVPIIYVLFGGGMASRIYVCVMISIFPIVTNTLFGLMSADPAQHDLFTLRGSSRWTRLTKLQFPAAMPAIFTGFRISAGLSVIGAIVGEQFFRQGEKPGIGIVMEQLRQKTRYPPMYGGLIIASLLGITVFFIFGWLSRLVVGHWYESKR